MMKVLILSTSPRRGLTLRFCRYLMGVVRDRHPSSSVSMMDFCDFDISMASQDEFPNPTSDFQGRLLSEWKSASLIVLCSPEYNWTASAATFVLLERLGSRSFREFFENKVFALVGVSSGRGGRQPALDMSRVLSKIIGFLSASSIVSPKILEVHDAGINLDEHAESQGHAAFENAVSAFAAYSLAAAERWNLQAK
jgi:chromate reductase